VIRELSDPGVGGSPRRYAGWFLHVADEEGAFLRAPIGHPALELVTMDQQRPPRWRSRVQASGGSVFFSDGAHDAAYLGTRLTELRQLISEHHTRVVQLMEERRSRSRRSTGARASSAGLRA
jgi:hypothetical protein